MNEEIATGQDQAVRDKANIQERLKVLERSMKQQKNVQRGR